MNDTTKVEVPAIEPVDQVARYYALCDARDQVNALNAPLEEALAEQVAIAEMTRVKAAEIAARIDANRGGEKWIALKKEIAFIARGLGKIPPRPAKE